MQKTAGSEAAFSLKRDGTEAAFVTIKSRVCWAHEGQIGAVSDGRTLTFSPAHVASPRATDRAGVAVETLIKVYAGAVVGSYARYLRRNLMERLVRCSQW